MNQERSTFIVVLYIYMRLLKYDMNMHETLWYENVWDIMIWKCLSYYNMKMYETLWYENVWDIMLWKCMRHYDMNMFEFLNTCIRTSL